MSLRQHLIDKLSDTMDPDNAEALVDAVIRSVFAAGFQAGFDVTREGWNGGARFDHCAPSEFTYGANPYDDALTAKWTAYLQTVVDQTKAQ